MAEINVKLLLSSQNTYASGQENGHFIVQHFIVDSRNFRSFLFVSDICDRTYLNFEKVEWNVVYRHRERSIAGRGERAGKVRRSMKGT